MITIRRVYGYLLTLVGLALVSVAAANLGQVLVDTAFGASRTSGDSYLRDTVARSGAAALVGLPVWLLHWRWINGWARRDAAERRSALRHLFLAIVLASGALVAAIAADMVLNQALGTLLGVSTAQTTDSIVRPLPFVSVAAIVWIGHWRVGQTDRALAGEAASAATLRRWYLFGGSFVAVVVLLGSMQALVATMWLSIVDPSGLSGSTLAGSAATSLVAVASWMLHLRYLPTRVTQSARATDERATLPYVYLFGGSALGVLGALSGASQLLYYILARMVGVERPGGAGGDLRVVIAEPLALILVYGAAWAYHRAALRRAEASFGDTRAAAGVRRLYVYLVSLLALAVAAFGSGSLLWALGDVVSNAGASATDIRERLAFSLTLVVVGGPVWLVHWRPQPVDGAETQSLARRLYLYLSLIGAALTLVGGASLALYRLLTLALDGRAATEVLVDLAHALSLIVVAGTVAAYHWRILRTDAQQQHTPASALRAVGAVATVRIDAADADRLEDALRAMRATGVQVTVLTEAADR